MFLENADEPARAFSPLAALIELLWAPFPQPKREMAKSAIHLCIVTPIENTGWFLECKALTRPWIKVRKTISDTDTLSTRAASSKANSQKGERGRMFSFNCRNGVRIPAGSFLKSLLASGLIE